MRRPRWHDAVIVLAIAGLAGLGVWALWWEDVLDLFHIEHGSDEGPPVHLPPAPNAQT